MTSLLGIKAPDDSSKILWNMQRAMSKAQAVPVVGPLIVSPLKAVISLVQFVVGFLFTILLVCINTCCRNSLKDHVLAGKHWTALKHTGLGLASLGYSLGNILTLGLLGYKVETVCEAVSSSSTITAQ